MDHGLRGTRIGAHTVFGGFDGELEPRVSYLFRCEHNHETTVTFSAEAELPDTWGCRVCGASATRIADDKPVDLGVSDAAAPRTHWDMLLERRSLEELEELLEERLNFLRERRATALADMRANS